MKQHCFTLNQVKVSNIITVDQLQIEAHTVTCIVGPSGSGKTTLLRLLNHMISPDSGDIQYFGQPLSTIDSIALRHEVILLSQTPVMFESTIRDNLIIGCDLVGEPIPSEEALSAMLQRLQINKGLDEKASVCSLGEKQRIALGRVLFRHPKVYLMDEPSASLDAHSERIIMDLIVEHTQQNNQTLVLITHNEQLANDHHFKRVRIEGGKVYE